jgi:hypothetical protein
MRTRNLIDTIKKNTLLLSILIAVTANAQEKFMYELNSPKQVIELPQEIDEISGMICKGSYVYAIDDEEGNLFKIDLKNPKQIESWKYGQGKDYEDVAYANGKFFVLNSNGHIVEFAEQFPIKDKKQTEPPVKGRNEFESLYYDPSINKIVALCKSCSGDKKDENTAWAFNISSNAFDKEPLYKISKKDIEKRSGKKIKQFKPSAATINPLTGELYILSSINKILVVAKDGKIENVVELKNKLFKQPEGICFGANGELLISNESAGKGPATILVFERK